METFFIYFYEIIYSFIRMYAIILPKGFKIMNVAIVR